MPKIITTNSPYSSIENGKKLSLKAKKQEVESYLIKYRKFKLRLECYDSITVISQNMVKDKEAMQSYVIFIDKVLDLISKESNDFITNEYLSENYNPDWWISKYTKQTFIRLRHIAFNEFLLYVK